MDASGYDEICRVLPRQPMTEIEQSEFNGFLLRAEKSGFQIQLHEQMSSPAAREAAFKSGAVALRTPFGGLDVVLAKTRTGRGFLWMERERWFLYLGRIDTNRLYHAKITANIYDAGEWILKACRTAQAEVSSD